MERIRIKRGDPQVEFDKNGYKFYPELAVNTAPKTGELSDRARELSENLTNEEVDEHKEYSKKNQRNAALKKDVKPFKRGDETVKATGTQILEYDEKNKTAFHHSRKTMTSNMHKKDDLNEKTTL